MPIRNSNDTRTYAVALILQAARNGSKRRCSLEDIGKEEPKEPNVPHLLQSMECIHILTPTALLVIPSKGGMQGLSLGVREFDKQFLQLRLGRAGIQLQVIDDAGAANVQKNMRYWECLNVLVCVKNPSAKHPRLPRSSSLLQDQVCLLDRFIDLWGRIQAE